MSLFVENGSVRHGRADEPDARSLAGRQPAIYATRLVREPGVVTTRNLEQFRAAHVHAKTPSCVKLACERCADIDAIERLASRGEVSVQPMHPPFPEAK